MLFVYVIVIVVDFRIVVANMDTRILMFGVTC